MQLKNVWTRALAPAFAGVAFALILAAPARAQEEAPPAVLDEPVVQVNNDVIMLSMLKRENGRGNDSHSTARSAATATSFCRREWVTGSSRGSWKS